MLLPLPISESADLIWIDVTQSESVFFLAGALCLSAGHHLRLTRGPAGNRTTTGSLSASARTTPYQLSHEDTWAAEEWERCICENQAFSILHQAQEGRPELIKKDGGEMLV